MPFRSRRSSAAGLTRPESRHARPSSPNTGAPVFVTCATCHRQEIFGHESNAKLLLHSLRAAKELHPFRMVAYVVLPDHLHLLITPNPDQSYSLIVASFKAMFSRDLKRSLGVAGRVEVWQDGFWDHVIRDEEDLRRHVDYVHYNPVKHGLVDKPEAWTISSYAEWRRRGAYADRWGWILPEFMRAMDASEWVG